MYFKEILAPHCLCTCCILNNDLEMFTLSVFMHIYIFLIVLIVEPKQIGFDKVNIIFIQHVIFYKFLCKLEGTF